MTIKVFFVYLVIILSKSNVFAQYYTVADTLFYNEKYAEAIDAYTNAINKAQDVNTIDIGNCYLRRGSSYEEFEKYDLATNDYFNALRIFETNGNNARIAAACQNIADVYFQKGNYDNAQKYFIRAKDLYVSVNDSVKVIGSLNSIGLVLYYIGDTVEAINQHKLAINTYKDKNLYPIFGSHYMNLGNCYITINKDSALFFYNKAYENALTNGDTALIGNIFANIGELYLKKKNYVNALSYLKKSEPITDVYSDSLSRSILYHNLAETYNALRQFSNAYNYAVKGRIMTENLFNSEKNKITVELSEKYESNKKDAKITSQTIENKLKTRNLIIAILGLFIASILGGLSFYNFKKKQKANLLLQQQNQYINKLNKQLEDSNQVKTKLFSIISHDLRSPVSSLYAYLQMMQQTNILPSTASTKTVSNQTEKLLETLEELLTWSKSQLHQFKPDTTSVNLIQQVHDAISLSVNEVEVKSLTIKIDIPQAVVIRTDANMLTIIIRNLLANAVQNAPAQSEIEITYKDSNPVHNLIITNLSIIDPSQAITALNSQLIDSKKYGLGKILIQEFSEKLHCSVLYTIQDNCIVTTLTIPYHATLA